MTIRTQTAILGIQERRCDCGRCRCVTLYSSEHCILCDAAFEILCSVISDFGLSPDVVHKVDIACDDDGSIDPVPVGLPAMRICQEVLTGLPDLDAVRGAVMHAVLRGCFSD